MNPRFDKLLDRVRGAWRYRWLALAVACVGAAAGWLLVFMLPDRYEAAAAVLVDTHTALKPALEGLAVQQDVGVQLNYVQESLLSDPEMVRVATLGGLLPESGGDPVQRAGVVSDLRDRIQLTIKSADDSPQPAGGLTYGISYQDTDRVRGLRIVSILLQTLIDKTLGGERQGSEHAQEFLQSEVQDMEKRLHASEDKLADFKSHHLGLMPTEQGGYFTQLQTETQAIENVKTKLIVAEDRRAALERQLHGDVAVSAAGPIVGGQQGMSVGMDTAARIAQTQAHLDELLLKYTDRHPDVIATREALAELKKRRAAEIASLRAGDASAIASSGASSNPVYQSIELALSQGDVDIAALRAELAQHQAKVQELHNLLDTAPQVEAEYQQLSRDYDVNKAQYTALLSNYQKAQLGERADNAGSVSFKIVEPPAVSVIPVWPQRGLLLTGILLAALAAGGGLAYFLDQLRPIVGSASGVAQLTDVRILATVGSAFPHRARQVLRREVWQVTFVTGCLVLAFIVVWSLSSYGMRVSLPALRHLVRTV